MKRRFSVLLLGMLAGISSRGLHAQARFYYPEPARGSVRERIAVPFGRADTTILVMDLFRPSRHAGPAPALIFMAGRMTPDGRTERQSNQAIRSWARLAAANGIVGVIPDLRGAAGTTDFRLLMSHLAAHAAEYGIDGNRLAAFAASGGVAGALPMVEDPQQTSIKAAVMYYGTATITAFRRDLPVMFVRAGLDHPDFNAEILRMVDMAVTQNAPVTFYNHHVGHHGFEWVDDNSETRHLIDQTLEFVKRATTPTFQAMLREGQRDADAAGLLSSGQYHEAALVFAELLVRRPADRLLQFRYTETLLADKQYGLACAQYRRDTPPSFNAIIPGTRACLLAWNADSAMAFLQTVRKDWLAAGGGRSLKADSIFAPLWGRTDFQALLKP